MDSKYAGTNIICDSYELYHKCVRPPYLAHCDPDCALDTFRHVMMAEPHEVCLALCSCVVTVLEEAADEFEDLD